MLTKYNLTLNIYVSLSLITGGESKKDHTGCKAR